MASKVIRKIISTTKAPAAVGAYSQGVLVDKTLYVSGQLGLVAETMDFISSDVEDQTRQALDNMGAILEAAGATFSNVIKTTVLLADINDFQKVNKVYGTYFKSTLPARAAYQVGNLPKAGRVEIEAIAVVGDIQDE